MLLVGFMHKRTHLTPSLVVLWSSIIASLTPLNLNSEPITHRLGTNWVLVNVCMCEREPPFALGTDTEACHACKAHFSTTEWEAARAAWTVICIVYCWTVVTTDNVRWRVSHALKHTRTHISVLETSSSTSPLIKHAKLTFNEESLSFLSTTVLEECAC